MHWPTKQIRTFLQRRYWLLAFFTCWGCSYWLLSHTFKAVEDNFGVDPTFYWTLSSFPPRYISHSLYSAFRLALPYWIASTIMSITGCLVAAYVVQVRRLEYSYKIFLSACLFFFFVFVCAGVISDVGTRLHVWTAPVILLGPAPSFSFLTIGGLIAGLVGVIALLHRAGRPAEPGGPRMHLH